jgi:hypothetical protein
MALSKAPAGPGNEGGALMKGIAKDMEGLIGKIKVCYGKK